MKKSTALVASLAALLLPASCSLFTSSADTGTLTVNFGPAAQSRALADAPDFFPRFGEVTLTVSGPGMDPVSTTVDSESGVASLAVPAGNDRTVELYAVPDWDATAAAFPTLAALMPTLVKAYGATAEVDISAGRSTEVALRLSVAETKILLPDAYNAGSLSAIDTIGQNPVSSEIGLSSFFNFTFDRYGYLFYYDDALGIARITNLENGPTSIGNQMWVPRMAADTKNSRLFVLGDGTLFLIDMFGDPVDNNPVILNDVDALPSTAIAIDKAGYVYLPVVNTQLDTGIGKFSVHFDGESYTGNLVAFKTQLELGFEESIFTINDMQVSGNYLYIACSTNGQDDAYHGKIVELKTSDLSKNNDIGWSETTPESSDSLSFFSPTRFLAIAPRKLYLSDEDNDTINRVVEVDLDSGSISAVQNVSGISFFQAY